MCAESTNVMGPEDVAARNLQPGTAYHVQLDDCCINGELYVGQFIRWNYQCGDAVFEMGEIGPFWGAWKAVEVAPHTKEEVKP